MKCPKNSQHIYQNHLKKCPWCEREQKMRGQDPFPSQDSVRRGTHRTKPSKPAPTPARTMPTIVAGPRTTQLGTTSNTAQNRPITHPARSNRRTASNRAPAKKIYKGNWWALGGGLFVYFLLKGCVSFFSQSSSMVASPPTSSQFSSSHSSAQQIQMLPPAKNYVNRKIDGIWKGKFDGDDAILTINTRANNTFSGILITHDRGGTARVAIQGVLPLGNRFMFKEVKVLRQNSKSRWSLGINSGKFSVFNTIQGIGRDTKHPAYQWYFSR